MVPAWYVRPPEPAGPAAGSAASPGRDDDDQRRANQLWTGWRCPMAALAAGPGKQM